MYTYIPEEKIAGIRELMIKKFSETRHLIPSLKIPEHCDYVDENKALGSGGYGEVILARNPRNNELVVLKCFKSQMELYLRASIIRINNGFIFPKFTVVLEYCCCDLSKFLINRVPYQAAHYKSIIQQILVGLEHIHSLGFIHRDLKLQNVLIGRGGCVKIADFGLSRLRNPFGNHTPHIGTKRYKPPEVLLELGRYDETFDIFNAGIILSELCLRTNLFVVNLSIIYGDVLLQGRTGRHVARSMVEMLGKIDNRSLPGSQRSHVYKYLFEGVRIESPLFKERMLQVGASMETINFATRLLAINPRNRPKASEALNDQYFVNYPHPDGDILPLLPRRNQIRQMKEMILNSMKEYTSVEDIHLNICSSCSYEKIGRLGGGAYGNVYKILLPDGKTYAALKEAKPSREMFELSTSTVRELFILAKLEHENIVKLVDVCIEGRQNNISIMVLPTLMFVMELCKGSLREVLSENTVMTETQRRTIMRQCFTGLAYMHGLRIMHRDLKPDNLLIGYDGVLKICDLGLARFKVAEAAKALYTPFIGTVNYGSPETLLGCTDYDESSDMWSAGCIMAELYTNTILFKGSTILGVLNSMFRICGSITNGTIPGIESSKNFYLIENLPQYRVSTLSIHLRTCIASTLACVLIERLLRHIKTQRLTAEQALNDLYFTSNQSKDVNLSDLLQEQYDLDIFQINRHEFNPFTSTKVFR
nr:cell division protein kinase 9 [Hymenolepis microstoma]